MTYPLKQPPRTHRPKLDTIVSTDPFGIRAGFAVHIVRRAIGADSREGGARELVQVLPCASRWAALRRASKLVDVARWGLS